LANAKPRQNRRRKISYWLLPWNRFPLRPLRLCGETAFEVVNYDPEKVELRGESGPFL